MDVLDREACYRALQTRDARFDGRLFVGVTSTGIYCRPVCPARTPKFENCRFYPSAAAAQEAGFRPCLRCRPETAPDLASWRGASNTVSRGLALIADGALDGEDGVEELGDRLGVGGRQLRRLFRQHLGASPVAVAQTRRVLFAKQLIQETRMPMVEVALASGFGSVRRFNETFQALYRRPPSALRRGSAPELLEGAAADAGVTLRLRYRPPYDWESLLGYLRERAIPGVEVVEAGVYRRTVSVEGRAGVVEVAHRPEINSLEATIRFPSVKALAQIVARVRRVFDTGADIDVIGAHLAADPLLAPLVALRPGLRAPGGWDGFELAVRAILGQQITVGAGRRLAGELVAICGEVVETGRPGLDRLFPSPQRLAAADLGPLGMPGARRSALLAMAEAAIADPHLFRPFGTVEEAIARLRAIKGVGEWTAQYIALRALRETDAFPASDIGLLRGVAALQGERPTPAALIDQAQPWRPWRAYAAQHLWAADAAEIASHAETLLIDRLETPIGEAVVVADRQGRLRALDFSDHEDRMLRILRLRHGACGLEPASDPAGLTRALARYFAGDLGSIDGLPVHSGGTAFQQSVWAALRQIPCSSTVSYGEIARRIGRPSAVRAVGLANGANPVAIVVPCHRVIGSGGDLTGYGGGIERKRWLLAHEGVPAFAAAA